MTLGITVPVKRYKALCVYGGSGLAALGLQWASVNFDGKAGGFDVIGSIDNDPLACEDFEMFTGVKATCLDLFDRDQYKAWHGKEPPPDWREATEDDIRAAAQHKIPDLVLITAPCKGFSGLLSEEKSNSVRYQALNRLSERGLFLVLETWKDNPPGLIMFENVPRISTRGKKFLNGIKSLLKAYGYALDERHHDLGPIGGLGQHRRRYLLVARHTTKVSSFLYYPPNLRMKSIGQVMEQQVPWMPDDPAAGPMHKLPRLQWKTWVRLALIPPGGDWRDLQNVKPGQYRIVPEGDSRFRIEQDRPTEVYQGPDIFHNVMRMRNWDEASGAVTAVPSGAKDAPLVADPRLGPSEGQQHANKYRVEAWDEAARTVTGSDRLGSGAPSVADVRLSEDPKRRAMKYHVQDGSDPAACVIGQTDVQAGAPLLADHRIGHTPMGKGHGAFWVQDSNDPSATITADPRPGKSGGASCVADPRLSQHGENFAGSPGLMGVNDWNDASKAVTGSATVSGSNTPAAIADPRLSHEPRDSSMRVGDWENPSGPVIGNAAVTSSNGTGAVADPRISDTPRFNNVQRVIDFEESSVAITAAAATSNAAGVVADPRYTREPRSGVYEVLDTEEPSKTVTGGRDPNGNMLSIADPRSLQHASTYGNMLPVTDWEGAANTVTGAAGPNQGANLVADPRITCTPRGNTKGPLGVLEWGRPGSTVTGSGDVHTGAAAVADPREQEGEPVTRIPADDERGVWFIRSPHKDKKGRHCIHRPMTTMELLALQSVPVVRPDGSPVVMAGKSDRTCREHIGNGLPPAAMKAIGEMALFSLLPSEEGAWIMSPMGTPVWVRGRTGEEIPLDLDAALAH